MMKREPVPTSLSTRATPPCASAIEATMARPSPLPPLSRVREGSPR